MKLKEVLHKNIEGDSVLKFRYATPFPYIVIDDFLNPEIAKQVLKEFPSPDSEIWYEYNNILEKKMASDDIRKFPKVIAQVIHCLNGKQFLDQLELLTGIQDIESDPYLHGGGLHMIKKGGKLDMHVDYGIHPKLGMERRINLIIYMSPWEEDWGGALEFWDGKWNGDKPELIGQKVKVYPKFNRAVIFETGDMSFHGHPDPLECPEGVYRKSIALYYVTEPREGIMQRRRAHFIARHGVDPEDEESEKFRIIRSSQKNIYA